MTAEVSSDNPQVSKDHEMEREEKLRLEKIELDSTFEIDLILPHTCILE